MAYIRHLSLRAMLRGGWDWEVKSLVPGQESSNSGCSLTDVMLLTMGHCGFCCWRRGDQNSVSLSFENWPHLTSDVVSCLALEGVPVPTFSPTLGKSRRVASVPVFQEAQLHPVLDELEFSASSWWYCVRAKDWRSAEICTRVPALLHN